MTLNLRHVAPLGGITIFFDNEEVVNKAWGLNWIKFQINSSLVILTLSKQSNFLHNKSMAEIKQSALCNSKESNPFLTILW
jgi:hypothetical protein